MVFAIYSVRWKLVIFQKKNGKKVPAAAKPAKKGEKGKQESIEAQKAPEKSESICLS